MSLARLQQAVADLLCDPQAIQAYRADRAAWLASRDLDPEDADVLRDIDQASLQTFHDIHTRDRAYFVETVLPLTIRRLGEDWWRPYFAAHPYGDDDTRLEVARYASWLRETSVDRAAIALAAFEKEKFALLDEPVFEPAPGNILRDPAAASLAPGLAVLLADVHIPTLVEDPTLLIGPQKGVILLRRDHDGVTSAWVDGPAGVMLLLVARKAEHDIRTLLGTRTGQDAYVEIASQGVLV